MRRPVQPTTKYCLNWPYLPWCCLSMLQPHWITVRPCFSENVWARFNYNYKLRREMWMVITSLTEMKRAHIFAKYSMHKGKGLSLPPPSIINIFHSTLQMFFVLCWHVDYLVVAAAAAEAAWVCVSVGRNVISRAKVYYKATANVKHYARYPLCAWPVEGIYIYTTQKNLRNILISWSLLNVIP